MNSLYYLHTPRMCITGRARFPSSSVRATLFTAGERIGSREGYSQGYLIRRGYAGTGICEARAEYRCGIEFEGGEAEANAWEGGASSRRRVAGGVVEVISETYLPVTQCWRCNARDCQGKHNSGGCGVDTDGGR